jgi:hypothetical protein
VLDPSGHLQDTGELESTLWLGLCREPVGCICICAFTPAGLLVWLRWCCNLEISCTRNTEPTVHRQAEHEPEFRTAVHGGWKS